jgi:secreted PhoX family phosphatase
MDSHPTFDEFDDINNPRPDETDFDRLADRALSRRGFLGALGAAGLVASATSLTPLKARAADRMGFKVVAANSLDTVTLPDGFSWKTLVRWGDPLWSTAPEFDHATRSTGAAQEKQFGDNNDGMELYTRDGRAVMVVNNEYTNRSIAFGANASKLPETEDDVRKGKASHGVSVFQVRPGASGWEVVLDAPENRRITADTPMDITGPARGHDLLKTEADPNGVTSLGTWNNCGAGRTPWGTYLACEENFNGYFSSSDKDMALPEGFERYGISHKDWGYNWAMTDDRFDIAKHPNEAQRAGYVVEIDPFNPSAAPKKRTALGRFKHENAEVVIAADGHVVVYLGDDERGEFLYRFVSTGKYSAGGDNSNLLKDGELYVAKFHDGGKGEWLHLTPATTGMASKADICIHTRQAASAVGATTMDRPEWVAANPHKAEAYCALTNNKNRAKKPNKGGDAAPAGGPNPRVGNNYGQIVRWRPMGGDHGAAKFAWDLFVIAGNPTVHDDAYAGSENITSQNMFNSPDGIKFDEAGILWIQTDGKYSNTGDFAGMGNNQMLAADPETGDIRRFMIGPKECEITGLTWSPDRRTMFVGIQHPGEKGDSHFPEGGAAVPRSCIVAVWRDDGAMIV